MPISNAFKSGSVASKDGTRIGYYRVGRGPAVVLVQGAMGRAEQYSQLAETLADAFTVYLPDRRGRGTSAAPYAASHAVAREVEDLGAILAESGAANVFGLSAGAIVALTAAATLSGIRKLALYEPPLYSGAWPAKALARFEDAVAAGDVVRAFALAGKFMQLSPLNRWLPIGLLGLLARRKLARDGDCTRLAGLVHDLQFDFRVVAEMHGRSREWVAVPAEILLLGGTRSPGYLEADLGFLHRLLPRASRVTLPGLDHSGPWNLSPRRKLRRNPRAVASALRAFFR